MQPFNQNFVPQGSPPPLDTPVKADAGQVDVLAMWHKFAELGKMLASVSTAGMPDSLAGELKTSLARFNTLMGQGGETPPVCPPERQVRPLVREGAPAPAREISVGEQIEKYLRHEKSTQKCKRAYREKEMALGVAKRYIYQFTPANDVSRDEAERLLAKIARRETAPRTERVRIALSSCWSWAMSRNLVKHIRNPFRKSTINDIREKARKVPNAEEFKAIYNACNDNDRAFLVVMATTGASANEMFSLTWDDIDFGKGTVHLEDRTETRKHIRLPVDVEVRPEVMTMLKGKRLDSGSPYVFTQPNGEPYSTKQHFLKRVCERAGVKCFTMTGITRLVHGMNTSKVQCPKDLPYCLPAADLESVNATF